MIYAEIDPNLPSPVNQENALLSEEQNTHYAEIDYNSNNMEASAPELQVRHELAGKKSTICPTQLVLLTGHCFSRSSQVSFNLMMSMFFILVTLDLLLNLAKKEIAPKWYEFGEVVGVPKEVLDSWYQYTLDQRVIEVLDYWLRHHPGSLTWNNVADTLNDVDLVHLAEKAQQVALTGG